MVSTDTKNATVYWLILAASISSVTSAILYLFQKCCGQVWGNINSVCFQSFATSLELRDETFHQVTNLLIFPRIFQQLELQTFKVIWNHDANAQTGDFVQWGWFRLPTRSYLLAFLALSGVTHYVYIPCDLTTVQIVGPADAISTLIDMSNVAATTRLTESQLSTLRHAFGMGDSWTQADIVCTMWEKRFFYCLLTVCYVGLVCLLKSGVARINATFVAVVATVVCAYWNNVFLEPRVWSHFPWRRRPSNTRTFPEDEMAQDLFALESYEPLTEGGTHLHNSAAPSRTMEATVVEASELLHLSSEEVYASSKTVYSMLIARGYYYEVVKQTAVILKPNELIVSFGDEAQIFAVQMRPLFMHYLAERTAIPDDSSLHICIYNPMVDPYMIELYQNFQKGVDRQNLLMVILPPLGHFNTSLDSHLLPRTRTAKCTQFVTTMSDFETLLLQMTAGFMPKLVLVLPTDECTASTHVHTPSEIWLSCQRVLGDKNCHWV